MCPGAFNIALRSLFQELTGRQLKFSMYGKPFPETYRWVTPVSRILFPISFSLVTRSVALAMIQVR